MSADRVLADVRRALQECFPDRADALLAEVERWRRHGGLQPPDGWLDSAYDLLAAVGVRRASGANAYQPEIISFTGEQRQGVEWRHQWRCPVTHAFFGTALSGYTEMPQFDATVELWNTDRGACFARGLSLLSLQANRIDFEVPLLVPPHETLEVRFQWDRHFDPLSRATVRLDGVLLRTSL